ncbi:unnamed protein product, partial [Coregonus sp. 'balchen']
MLISLLPSVVVHPGDNITLQCTNVLKVQTSQRLRASVHRVYVHLSAVTRILTKSQSNIVKCNGTIAIVGEDDDGIMYLLHLVVILGVVTDVLLIVILILVLNITREAKTHRFS